MLCYKENLVQKSLILRFQCQHLMCRLKCIRESVKHDVNGKGRTAKITSDFLFFSCNP